MTAIPVGNTFVRMACSIVPAPQLFLYFRQWALGAPAVTKLYAVGSACKYTPASFPEREREVKECTTDDWWRLLWFAWMDGWTDGWMYTESTTNHR